MQRCAAPSGSLRAWVVRMPMACLTVRLPDSCLQQPMRPRICIAVRQRPAACTFRHLATNTERQAAAGVPSCCPTRTTASGGATSSAPSTTARPAGPAGTARTRPPVAAAPEPGTAGACPLAHSALCCPSRCAGLPSMVSAGCSCHDMCQPGFLAVCQAAASCCSSCCIQGSLSHSAATSLGQ